MIEARRQITGKEIGLHRIENTLRNMHDQNSETIATRFLDCAKNETGTIPQDDDYTFVMVDVFAVGAVQTKFS